MSLLQNYVLWLGFSKSVWNRSTQKWAVLEIASFGKYLLNQRFGFVNFYFIYFYLGSLQLIHAGIIICKSASPFFLYFYTACVKII